jgi:RHS repeat-associated protein
VATYNSQDQILTYGSKSFTWDQNGFLKTMSEGGQITTYNYDIQHNLRSVELPNGEQVEYIIDARNRRIGKKVNGIQTEGFLYKDQLNPYAWMDGSGNEKAIFIYGEMTHVPSYMIKSGIKYKYVTDHLGSVRALVNTSTGTLAQSITYDEFGNQLSNSNPDFQPFGYVGGITDYDTDLIRFGARDYDPSKGRWTSKEPLGFGGALNWYVYCDNDPMNKVDVNGLKVDSFIRKVTELACNAASVDLNISGFAKAGGEVGVSLSLEDGGLQLYGGIGLGGGGGVSVSLPISTETADIEGGLYYKESATGVVGGAGGAASYSTQTGISSGPAIGAQGSASVTVGLMSKKFDLGFVSEFISQICPEPPLDETELPEIEGNKEMPCSNF